MTTEMTKADVQRQAIATARIDKSRTLLLTARVGMLKFAQVAWDVRENQDWKELGYDSWGNFCADAEVYDMAQKSVDQYISLYERLIVQKKQSVEDLAGIGPNKLRMLDRLLEAGEKLSDWMPKARASGERDFCDLGRNCLDGKPLPDHVGNAIAKIRPCPLWDACEGKCKGGVDVKTWAKKQEKPAREPV